VPEENEVYCLQSFLHPSTTSKPFDCLQTSIPPDLHAFQTYVWIVSRIFRALCLSSALLAAFIWARWSSGALAVVVVAVARRWRCVETIAICELGSAMQVR
jgi:hypothetical protein